MKKLAFVASGFLFFLTFSACSLNKHPGDNVVEVEKISITASVFPLYDLTRQIVKDKANVSMLLPPGVDIHDFELSAKNMADVFNSDVFLYVGSKCEPWVDKNFVEEAQNRSNVFDVSSKVSFIKLGDSVDPHIWLDLGNVDKVLFCVLEILCDKDPKNADFYRTNAKIYSDNLKNLDEKFKKIVDSAKLKKILFASRFAGNYFVNKYRLQCVAAYTSCDDHAEPDAKRVAEIINCIKNDKLSFVFYEYGNSSKLAETISAETGAKILRFNSMHTVDSSEFNKGVTYFDLMSENLKNLEQGLS